MDYCPHRPSRPRYVNVVQYGKPPLEHLSSRQVIIQVARLKILVSSTIHRTAGLHQSILCKLRLIIPSRLRNTKSVPTFLMLISTLWVLRKLVMSLWRSSRRPNRMSNFLRLSSISMPLSPSLTGRTLPWSMTRCTV